MAKKLTDEEKAQLEALQSRAHLVEDEPDDGDDDEPLTPISRKKGRKLLNAFGLDLQDDEPDDGGTDDEPNPKPEDKAPLPKPDKKAPVKDPASPPRSRYFS